MREFTSVLNDLLGLEQFLIEQKLYLAAGMVRGLQETVMERMGLQSPFLWRRPKEISASRPTPVKVRSWKEFYKIFDELPNKFRKMVFDEWEGPEYDKWNMYEGLVVGLAGVYYQLSLSLEGAPVLKHYLQFRAQQMLGGRPTLEIDTAWRWWQELRKLAKVLLKIHEDTGEYFSEFISGRYRDISEWALDEVVEANTPDDYREYGVFSTTAFRRIRQWTHHGDFRNMLITRLIFAVEEQVFREINSLIEEALKSGFPAEQVDEGTVMEILSQTPFVRDGSSSPTLDFLGLRVKVAKVGSEAESPFHFVFSVEPTNDLGQKIIGNFTSEYPPTYHLGSAAVYVITSERNVWEIVRTLNYEGVQNALRELVEQNLGDTWKALAFLKDLKERGLLEWIDILSRALDWIEGLKEEPDTQVKAWEAIVDFVRSYYERQREGWVTGEEVASQIRNWLLEAEDMLYNYGDLEAPPTDREEQEKFIEDVQDFIVETERMLSTLHGAAGMIVKLTRSGTYPEIFHLIGLREGILLPPVARRYWRYEGDKKLLLKWLIISKVFGVAV